MKLAGNGQKVNEIELNLRSMNTRFKCFVNPFPYAVDKDLFGRNAAVITFEDSGEIDSLIMMLEKFRDQNAGYIGSWK